mgnify:CR=1 FL=1
MKRIRDSHRIMKIFGRVVNIGIIHITADGFDLISFRFGNGKEIGFRILLTTALNDVQNVTAEEIHDNESIFKIRV